ncbi:tail fiber assembly protein, partial [Bilophila wadsworthia]|uniref:tail fiber assembly protein n=1 Tax=Bilophila wadsworthia TaxID=35833 RepID=UPI0026DF861C
RKETRAYVVGKLCVPHPDDDTVPDEVRRQFAELWADVDAYAKAHPDMVTEEHAYVPPVPTVEELAARVRTERDRRITATDYLVMPDYPLDTDKLEEIKVYRQALRDLPQQPGFPWGGPDDPACPWPIFR